MLCCFLLDVFDRLMSSNILIVVGYLYLFGVIFDGDGVNFVIFFQNVMCMMLCLFDDDGYEMMLIDLFECSGYVWYVYFFGMCLGQKYGY